MSIKVKCSKHGEVEAHVIDARRYVVMCGQCWMTACSRGEVPVILEEKQESHEDACRRIYGFDKAPMVGPRIIEDET